MEGLSGKTAILTDRAAAVRHRARQAGQRSRR
jgi:hypothetical protein